LPRGTQPEKLSLGADVSITAKVAIGPMSGKAGAFGISVDMVVSLPGMERGAAEALVATAHEVCPYSNATRGNIDVNLSLA
jgi:osmotically inducible protein OsmC